MADEPKDPLAIPDSPLAGPAKRGAAELLAHLGTFSTRSPITHEEAEAIKREIADGAWSASDLGRLVAALDKAHGRAAGPGKKAIRADIMVLRSPAPNLNETSARPDRVPLSVQEIAWMFRDHYKGRAIYATNRQWWLYRDAGYWSRASDPEIDGAIIRMVREAGGRPDTSQVKNPLHVIQSARGWAAAELAGGDDPMGLNAMPRPLINVQNGTLELDPATGAWHLRGHRPEDRLTTQLPVAYDPAATCPEFDSLLGRIFGEDHATRDAALELLAYILSPCRFTKVFAIFYGVSNSGKSAPMQILSALLGPASMNRPMSGLGASADRVPRDAIASLVGKHLVFDDDFARGAHLPDGYIKQTSEWKAFTGKHLYKDEFQFICYAVPVICSNHAPTTSDPTPAFTTRARIFAMNRAIPASDANFGAKDRIIARELSGVLAKLLAVFPAIWRSRVLPESPAMNRAKREWLRGASVLHALLDALDGDGSPQQYDADGMYGLYRHYIATRSPGSKTMGQVRFLEDLRAVVPPEDREGAELWTVTPSPTFFRLAIVPGIP